MTLTLLLLTYLLLHRGVGTHDVDEWTASWSPRVEMERNSKLKRLKSMEYSILNNENVIDTKLENTDNINNYNRHPVNKNTNYNINDINNNQYDDENIKFLQETAMSGAELREKIEKYETLDYIKSALVPKNSKFIVFRTVLLVVSV